MNRNHIEQAVRALWDARLHNDLDAMMELLADDAVYAMNGRGTGVPALLKPTEGKPGVREIFRELLDVWHFDNWREVSLVIEGNKAFLHWSARATCVPTKKSDDFDVFDVFTFRDGQIIKMHQSTDTALMMSLATG
jgi:ketosteroid isomerase-like protein